MRVPRARNAVPSDIIDNSEMGLAAGTKLGPYEVVALLGAGGMGEVYRARDTRLERTVAIKVLPASLSSDASLRQRLEREAKAVSRISHPHICTLHDIGHQAGVDYLVMEYVEGETLEQRLTKGPLPTEQTVRYAREIADALAKAHKLGITHRDLKPSNVMLTKSGAKLMDFGLAKQGGPTPLAPALTEMTIEQAKLTGAGTIVGTFQYMAPEQLEGREADSRSDIFALGEVIYEMATGKPAFSGKSRATLIASILTAEPPPITQLQPVTPRALERVVKKCLVKDPDDRWQSASDLATELNWIAEAVREITSRPALRGRERFSWGLAAGCLVLLIWLGVVRLRGTGPSEREPMRLSLLPPQSTSFVPNNFAVSPDGRRLAFLAAAPDGLTALWIRSLRAATAAQLTGTEGAMYPFWSPDGRQIGFFASGKLKTVDPSGGAVQIICDAAAGAGGTWNSQGTIVFAPTLAGPLFKVSASGGTPEQATKITVSVGNQAHRWPSFLPDGIHFLYFVDWSTGPNSAPNGIYVGSVTSLDSKMISSEIVGNTQFVSGRLFYVRDRSLMAQPFDAQTMRATGPAEPVASQELEQETAFSHAGFSVSDNGVVVFQSAADSVSRLSWFDRVGRQMDEFPAIGYRDPALSRDGRVLAVSSDDERNGKHYIRIYDLARATSTRISEGGTDVFPILSPDSKTVAYGSSDAKGSYIPTIASDGSGSTERLVEGRNLIPNDWSHDGRYLVYMNFQYGLPRLDIYDFAKRSQTPYGTGAEAQFSPDGNWLAFASGGRTGSVGEVLAAPFPGPGARIQISNHGGAQARWRPDGKELFYISPDKKLMAVSVDTSHGKLVAGIPHPLFQTRIIAANFVLFQYAISPDGNSFLINSLPSVGATPLTVLTK